jgi:hypothetical protein
LFSTSSTPCPTDLAINSGLRDAGLWVFTEMNLADPMAFARMQVEAAEEEDDDVDA